MRRGLAESGKKALPGHAATGLSTTKKGEPIADGFAFSLVQIPASRTRELTREVLHQRDEIGGEAGRGTTDAGMGRSWHRHRGLAGIVLWPSTPEEHMSAVLLRFLFPATCGSSLSWRLALNAATWTAPRSRVDG